MDRAAKLMKNIPSHNFDRKEVLPIASIAAAVSIFYASYQMLSSGQETQKVDKKIPIPDSSYPYVGHLMSLGDLPGRTVAKWHRELGPILNLKMGVQNWIMVDDPVLAHKIFVSRGAETAFRPYSVYGHEYHNVGGKGISFSQPDGHWKVTRAAAISVLGPKHIERYMPTIHKESKNLVTALIETTEREGSIDPFKNLELNSMNVITNAAFSRSFDSVKDPIFLKLSEVSEVTMKYAAIENDMPNFLPILSVYDYFFGQQAVQKNFVDKERNPLLRQLIKEAAVAEGPNIIKSFVEDGFNLSEDEKLAISADLLVGGTDTTSVTLYWVIAIMCHYPDIQKKVAAEIDEFIKANGRIPSFKERDQFPYCISVMKESMRYRPTTSFGLAHTAREDICVDDYFIPKGSTIISSMESMHMNPNFFTDPEKFNPDRYLNSIKTMQSSANGKILERDHFNFGWGRRMCPAIYLAETELFSAFIQIFSRCLIEPTNDGMPDIEGAVSGTLTVMANHYKVKFIKRSDSLI